jgi:site-specific DNA recombinase
MPALRAVAYYRKSNDDDGGSIEQQREWARAVCEREGVELVQEFADQSKKGHETATRTAFHEMLAFCQDQARKRMPILAVVCWHTNRFSRADSQETSWFIWEFRKAGVSRLLTSNRWYDFERMEDRVISNIEQDTSNHKGMTDLAKSTTRGRLDAAKAGRWAGGPVPIGYRAEREEVIVKGQRRLRPKRLILGPDAEVSAVRLIFNLYLNTPLGLKGIAQELTARGIPTQKGRGAWTSSTVKKILTNPAYVGRISWNKKSHGKFIGVIDGNPVDRPADKGKSRDNDKDQWIERDDRHEPIVDLVTFERCQQKLAGRSKGRRPTRGTFVLTGLLRCAHCGRAMVGRTDASKRRVYFCGAFNACGPDACHYNAVLADALADALLAKLRTAWGEDNIDTIRDELVRQYTAEAAVGGRKVEGMRRRLKQLDADLAAGIARLCTIDMSLFDGYQANLKTMQAVRDRLGAELRREEATPTPAGDVLRRVDAAVVKMRALSSAAASKEPDLLRELLAEVVERIEVWFHHEPYGKKTRCKFAKALVWVREDVSLLYANVLNASE